MRLVLARWTSIIPTVILLLLAAGCGSEREPKIAFGVDGCTECGMMIDKENEAAGFLVDREFSPFCSTGCLLQSYENRRKQDQPLPDRIVISDYDGSGLHPAGEMTFLLTESLPTVMKWGILGFVDRESALAHRHSEDERLVDWVGLRALRGEPDRTIELVLGPDGLTPETIQLEKGALVVWEIEGRELETDHVLRVRGYEHLGEITVPASGTPVTFRMLATKPGEGFPLIRESDGEVVGRVRVTGAHTPDEEAL
ncbi:MAG: hypothetical protein WBH85_16870 [Thermoanaerobaculia bacterium]